MNEFLEAAKKYLDTGWHPIPVEPRGKRPLAAWKKYMAEAPTPEDLERWWAETPDANIALPTGRGIFVLDVDGEEGLNALTGVGISLNELSKIAPTVSTGKGWHVYFQGNVPDRIGVLPKVDVRSDGGYVVAPPSVHASGRRYEWSNGFPAQFPLAPPALLELLSRPHRPTPAAETSDWVTLALTGVGEGERDVTCTKLAGYFIGKGLPQAAVDMILCDWGERCDPPFSEELVRKCVRSIAERHVPDEAAGPPSTIGKVLDKVVANLNLPPEERRVRSTALPGLDRLLAGGVSPGEMVLLGALPGVGKTALACQIGRRTAKAGAGVLFVSREMTEDALGRRLLVQEALVHAESLKTGELTDVEREMVAAAVTRLRYLPFWISQDIVSVDQLELALKEYKPGQLGFVIVDYLQLMRGQGEIGNKRAIVEYVSQELKRFAIQYNVPILVLSSMRRLQKLRDGSTPPPLMSDLRESGELEHDGDIVLIMTREFNAEIADLIVAKNRDGRVGKIKLKFTGELQKFEEARQ